MSWPKVRLGDVCEEKVTRLKTISAAEIEYIDIGSVDNRQKRITGTTRYDAATAPGRAQQVVQIGDVLVSTVRPNLNAVAVVDVDSKVPLIESTGFCVLRVKGSLDAKYVFYFAQTQPFIEALVAESEKASYPSVTDTIVKKVQIPLPPLSEQRKIAASVDKAMKRVDAIERQFEKLRETSAACFKAELKATFDSAAWDVRLSEQCEVITDGDHLPPPKTSSGIPFLVISDVAAGRLNFENTRFVPREYFDEIQASRKPRSGDVLLTVTGSYGIPVEVDVDREFCFQRHIALVRSSKFLPRFLVYLFLSPKSKRYFEHVATGAAQKTVSLSNLRSMNVCCPSVADQRRLVAHLDAAKARCDGISALAARGLANCARMRKAILAEAFAV